MKIELKKSVNFTNTQVGDVVFCARHGVGKITQISPPTQLALQYPISATFPNKVGCSYTWTGKLVVNDAYASLYYYNPETQEILYSRPEPKINWASYEGKEILVRSGNIETVKTLWKYAPEFQKPFLCHDHEGVLWTGITSWPHAEVIEEEA